MRICDEHPEILARMARIERKLDILVPLAIGIALSLGVNIVGLLGVGA